MEGCSQAFLKLEPIRTLPPKKDQSENFGHVVFYLRDVTPWMTPRVVIQGFATNENTHLLKLTNRKNPGTK